MTAPRVNVSARLADVRNRIADRSLFAVAWLGPLALAASFSRAADVGAQPIWFIQLAGYGLVLVATFVRRRLSLLVRALVLVGVLFVLGIAGLAAWGLAGMGAFFLFAAVTLTAVILGTRAGMTALGVAVVSLAVMALVVQRGMLSFGFDANQYIVAPAAWLTAVVATGFFSAIVVASLGRLDSSFLGLSEELGVIAADMERTGEDLTREIVSSEESRERAQAIFDATADGIVTIDESGIILEFNRSAENLFGYVAAEVVGKNVKLLAPSPHHEKHEEYINRYVETGVPRIIGGERELRGRRKDGSTFHMALRVTETMVGGERVFIGTTQDISERIFAREESQALNTFVISLLQQNTLDDLLWTTARSIGELLAFDDCVIYLLQGANLVQVAAYGAKNPQGRQIKNPITFSLGSGIVGSVAETGVAEIVPDTQKDPRYVFDEFSGRSELTVPIVYQGQVLGVLDTESSELGGFTTTDLDRFQAIANITASRIASAIEEQERRRAEEALRQALDELEQRVQERTAELSQAKDRTQKIIDSAHDAVITIDSAGRITEWNPSAEKVFGWPRAKVIGQPVTEFIVPERYRQVVTDSALKVLKQGGGRMVRGPFEAEGLRRGGEEFPVEMYVAPTPDAQGMFLTGFIRDVTDRRRAELAGQAVREQELAFGGAIQEMFLRGHPPSGVPGLSIGYSARPSQDLDGDFVDFLAYRDQMVDVVLGDVMGKGVPAALLGAATKSSFARAFMNLMTGTGGRVPSPVEVVTDVHQQVTPRLVELDSFVTACYARFDLESRHVEFVDCGHPKTLHYHARTGLCDSLQGRNPPFGFVADHVYVQDAVAFETDDIFLMYSDGLTEARASSGEMFGVERLRELVVSAHEHEPKELIEIIERRVLEFAEQNARADDLSVVALRIGTWVNRKPQEVRELKVSRTMDSLAAAREFISSCLSDLEALPDGFVAELQLAVQETLTNIFRHASDEELTPVSIALQNLQDRATVQILYEGEFFRPEGIATLPALTDYPESGFGLYLIEQCVDSAAYARHADGRNGVYLVKFF